MHPANKFESHKLFVSGALSVTPVIPYLWASNTVSMFSHIKWFFMWEFEFDPHLTIQTFDLRRDHK